MRSFQGLSLGLAAALSLVLAPGCGSGGPEMGRVSGTVTFGGKPLEKGSISFTPTDGQRPSATGTISNGSYTLQTNEPGDGAVVGEYKVAVSDVDSEALNTALPGAPVPKQKSSVPKKYQDANSSGLTSKVVSGRQTANFDLTP